eukprot:jgi/Galph1/4280/GphlegSOOS_G2901.1
MPKGRKVSRRKQKGRESKRTKNQSNSKPQKPIQPAFKGNKNTKSPLSSSGVSTKTRLEDILAQEWKGNVVPPKGLNNLGNTCFLNAVLQNVARLGPWRRYFLGPSFQSGEGSFTLALRVFFHSMWCLQDRSVLSPKKLLEHLGRQSSRFRGTSQQDSHEALRVIIELLAEETEEPTKDNNSEQSGSDWDGEETLQSLLFGKLKSCVECEQCHTVSTVEEPFVDISLSLVKEDMLENDSIGGCSMAGGCHSRGLNSNQDWHSSCTVNEETVYIGENMSTSTNNACVSNSKKQLVDNISNRMNEAWDEVIPLFSNGESRVQQDNNDEGSSQDDVNDLSMGIECLFVDEETPGDSQQTQYFSTSEANACSFDRCHVRGDETNRGNISKRVGKQQSTSLYECVEDSLRAFLEPEILQGENGYYCESCSKQSNKSEKDAQVGLNVRTRAKKHFIIQSLAPVVIIHMKRFRQVGFGFEKVSGRIAFPLEWDLSPLSASKSANASCNEYYLTGIVVHQGSLEWGHYTAYIRGACSPQDHHWYYCSDDHIELVDEEQVSQSEAYLLFYCKKEQQ